MRIILILSLCLCGRPTITKAASITFVQDGWSLGGPLTVSFSGDDVNGDGTIDGGELNAFGATWITPAADLTTWTLSDIQPDSFLFTGLENHLFFLSNADFSLVSTAFEGEYLASVFDKYLFPVDSTTAAPTAVPEPLGLCAGGLTALCVWALLRRSRVR